MRDIGIDLGTANVVIYLRGKGIVLNEPSVVAIDTETKKVLAVGNDANQMLGKTPGKINAIRPMKDGVIADFEVTEEMLKHFIKKSVGNSFFKPRILICCPANITQVEKNAIIEAAERVGAKKVFLEEEPKVAAVGAGLDIAKPSGNMVIDIGGGTTDIAVLSLGNIVNSASIKIAGNTFDTAIINYLKDKYKLLIGEKTAEDIKIEIGTVNSDAKKMRRDVKGRDLESGLPKTVTISSVEVADALKDLVYQIIKAAKGVLEECPPELAADIVDKGIIITGGGAMIDGLPALLEKELKVPIFVADKPLSCVAEGCGLMLENIKLLLD